MLCLGIKRVQMSARGLRIFPDSANYDSHPSYGHVITSLITSLRKFKFRMGNYRVLWDSHDKIMSTLEKSMRSVLLSFS